MTASRNIQIPYALFDRIYLFFEYLDITNQSFPNYYACGVILSELRKKQQSINLRNTYTKIKQATDNNQKRTAYADYVKLKRKNFGINKS